MLKCRSLDDSNYPTTTVYNIRIGSWREEFVRRSCNLVPGDFDWWQKDSPYGLLLIIRCATRSRRAFDCREATVLSRNDAHLFGVCCIIRTRNRASPEQLIVLFFSPASWKTSFENILLGSPCGPSNSNPPLLHRPLETYFRKYPVIGKWNYFDWSIYHIFLLLFSSLFLLLVLPFSYIFFTFLFSSIIMGKNSDILYIYYWIVQIYMEIHTFMKIIEGLGSRQGLAIFIKYLFKYF